MALKGTGKKDQGATWKMTPVKVSRNHEPARIAPADRCVSALDLREDPLYQLKPARFRAKVRVSEIDRLLYGSD
jgi:hypothetical protein